MEKIKSYNLILDEERSFVINLMLFTTLSNPQFELSLNKYNLRDVYNDLVKELNKKEHLAGFCKDPTCDYKENEKF